MNDKLKQLTKKKHELDKLQPLPPELVTNLDEWFKVELTYSSNAIEGNTLSRIETAEVIEKGVNAVIPGKSLKDQLEAINHAKALDFIKKLARFAKAPARRAYRRKSHQFLTEDDIKGIHKIILTGIDDEWAGKYAVPYAMQEFILWLEGQQEIHPVRIAADAHFKFVGIHPFIDGNGRTGRLLMNLILVMHGYPMAVIRQEDRTQYLATFDEARRKNMRPFYDLVESAVERSLDAYINSGQNKPIMRELNPKSNKQKLFKIGELAKETEETLHTIRHWTQKGLLVAAEHTNSGYQLYDRSMIERIKEIRRLQIEERLSIDEIKQRLVDVLR